MRNKHPYSPVPRCLTATRRQILHGFGALLGGVVTGCADAKQSDALGATGSPPGGAPGSLHGGAGGTAANAGFGGSAGTGALRKNASDRVQLGLTGITISRDAVALDCLDGFTIGFTSTAEFQQIAQKISSV